MVGDMAKRILIISGNGLMALAVLLSGYHMIAGFCRIIMDYEDGRVTRQFYISAGWGVLMCALCLGWYGIWYRWFRKRPTVMAEDGESG